MKTRISHPGKPNAYSTVLETDDDDDAFYNDQFDCRMKNFCGSTGESVTSASNVLHIRFFAEHEAINSSFDILYTAFRDKPQGTCEFLC